MLQRSCNGPALRQARREWYAASCHLAVGLTSASLPVLTSCLRACLVCTEYTRCSCGLADFDDRQAGVSERFAAVGTCGNSSTSAIRPLALPTHSSAVSGVHTLGTIPPSGVSIAGRGQVFVAGVTLWCRQALPCQWELWPRRTPSALEARAHPSRARVCVQP